MLPRVCLQISCRKNKRARYVPTLFGTERYRRYTTNCSYPRGTKAGETPESTPKWYRLARCWRQRWSFSCGAHEIEKFVDRFVTNNARKLQMQMQWEMRLIEDKIFGRANCQRRANVGMGRSPGTVLPPEEREGGTRSGWKVGLPFSILAVSSGDMRYEQTRVQGVMSPLDIATAPEHQNALVGSGGRGALRALLRTDHSIPISQE